jgi:propionyl-CoA carboxylase alpha chain
MPAKKPADLSQSLAPPLPGLLVSFAVSEGPKIKAGENRRRSRRKMENVLRAEHNGTIKTLCAQLGDSLAVDPTVLEFV